MMLRTGLLAALLGILSGCAVTHTVTINAKPADASIRIDGIERGTQPIIEPFVFQNSADTHNVTVSRPGYKDSNLTLTRDDERKTLNIELRPQTKVIRINVQPVKGMVSIDGKPVSAEPTDAVTRELEFTLDSKNQWTTHTVTVDRQNYQSASQTIRYLGDSNYTLNLLPLTKTVSIVTDPPGATVFLDYQKLGVSPLKDVSVDVPVDPDTNEFKPRHLRAERPGYDPVTVDLGWDNGKTDYRVDLAAKTKTIHFNTEPAGATIKIEGADVAPDGNATLQFPPTNERGDLRTYNAVISKKTADAEWESQTLQIAWENGRQDYTVHLKEILTRPVEMLSVTPQRNDDGWDVAPVWTTTVAMKDTTEGPGRGSPQQMTRLARGAQIGSMALSPDGSKLLLTILSGPKTGQKGDFRSQMLVLRTDGNGGEDIISDGKSLDLMPNFTPDGDRIVFSSNRSGKRLNIWRMSANGEAGVTRLTPGDTQDLWPTVDSDPKQRLFYEALVDTRPDPRLYMTQLGTIFVTDLTNVSGMQPKVSPKNDAILFTATNEKTGKRDIYRMPDRGGIPENLTNTPDADEYDPAWSKDGSKIIYTSDRTDDTTDMRQYDLWMQDLSKPNSEPTRVTHNGSLDDSPIFDTGNNRIYFRSNRGGQWQVWRMDLR